MPGEPDSRRPWAIFLTVAILAIGAAAGGVWYLNRPKAAGPAVAQQEASQDAVAPPAVPPAPVEPVPPRAQPLASTPAVPPAPVAPPAGNPPLREVPVNTPPIVPAKDAPAVVYLEPAAVEGPNDPVTGLLRRELYRQAVLLAARDELGLATRDGSVGELPPSGIPSNQRLVVSAELAVGRPHRVGIEAGAGREAWRAEGAGPAIAEESPQEAVVTAEAFSRTGFVSALKRAGLAGEPNKTDGTGAVPPEVEAWLGQMNFSSQFFALRALHTAARKSGESPGLLGALVRAYAHLGMLTDAQWGSAPWVFKARALLYAQRLVAREPAAAWGYWHRAYAAAMTGLHAAALEDLKAASGARGGSAGVPVWVPLIEALCRFDNARLKTAFGDARLGETARFFHFLAVESGSSRSLAASAAAALMVKYPDCDRVFDGLAALGLSERSSAPSLAYRTFAERFTRHLREAPGLPKSVSDLVAKNAAETDLVRALIEPGGPATDPADPSWTLLGRFAQEERVVQVAGRLEFLRDELKAPTEGFFQTAAPIVTGHPLYPFLETFVIDPQRWPQEYQDRLRATRVPALSYRHLSLLRAQKRLGPNEAARAAQVAQVHGDWLYHDAATALRETKEGLNLTRFARRLLLVSPYSPAGRAAFVRYDPSVPAQLIAAWEAETQHPEVFEALASRAAAAGKWEEAEKYFRRALDLSPDLGFYRLAADWYKSHGDTLKWAAALDAFLKTEDTGLDHARVRVELANYYLAQKDYRKAHEYAEAAAEFGAAPALQCAAACADAVEDWAKAEAHVRRLSDQFPDSVGIWLIWCCRSGRGDATAAAKLVEERLGKVKGEPSPSELLAAAIFRALTGRPDLAPDLLVSAHRRQRNDAALLLGASLCDTLEDVGGRERLLNEMEIGTYAAARNVFFAARNESEEFVPTAEDMDAAVKKTAPGGRGLVCYAFGMYALRRGDSKRAAEYLKRAVDESEPKISAPAALAAVALRSMAKK